MIIELEVAVEAMSQDSGKALLSPNKVPVGGIASCRTSVKKAASLRCFGPELLLIS